MNKSLFDVTPDTSVQTQRTITAVAPIIPRGLSRSQSAAYIGISPSLFDQLVTDRRMPRPKRINARVVWDRYELDNAFSSLSDDKTEANEWNEL